MPQSFASLHVHIVFSIKNRRSLITPELAERLFPFIGGLACDRKCVLLRINGMPDHVHLLVSMARDISVSELVGALKANSSGWVHDNFPALADFSWQQGYAALAVGKSGVPRVAEYIENQAAHHAKRSFQQELRILLDKHGIPYDERYMWD